MRACRPHLKSPPLRQKKKKGFSNPRNKALFIIILFFSSYQYGSYITTFGVYALWVMRRTDATASPPRPMKKKKIKSKIYIEKKVNKKKWRRWCITHPAVFVFVFFFFLTRAIDLLYTLFFRTERDRIFDQKVLANTLIDPYVYACMYIYIILKRCRIPRGENARFR